MLNFLTHLRTRWRFSERPGETLVRCPSYCPTAICDEREALKLSPFWAGLQLYTSQWASLPLVTYTRDQDGGRDRAKQNPAFKLLDSRPNPGMSRPAFFAYLCRDYFIRGEFFVLVRRRAGKVDALFPIPAASVTSITLDQNWRKRYEIDGGSTVYEHKEIIHVIHTSEDGIRGVPFWTYAASALGVHKQAQDAAGAFFRNSVRPAVAIEYAPGVKKPDPEARKVADDQFNAEQASADNAGKTLTIYGGTVKPLFSSTAEDAGIIDGLSASVADIARWYGVNASDLGDRQHSKYNSLAADNASFYQRSLRPLLDKVECEFNHILFNDDPDLYCEFKAEAVLKGSPGDQADLVTKLIQSGVMLRSEAREVFNMPPVAGLDTPTLPLNLGGNPQTSTVTPPPTPETDGNPDQNA